MLIIVYNQKFVKGPYFLNRSLNLLASLKIRRSGSQNKALIPNISNPITRRKPTGVKGVMTEIKPIIIKNIPTAFLIFGFCVQVLLKYSFIVDRIVRDLKYLYKDISC